MSDFEYLYTLAEVSASFVGFTAIVLAVSPRNLAHGSIESTYTHWLVERSFATLGFSLLPPLLDKLDLPAQSAWQVASGLLALYAINIAYRTIRTRGQVGDVPNVPILAVPVFRSLSVFGATSIVLQVSRVFGALPEFAEAIYLFGVTWLMTLAGVLFVTLIQIGNREPS